MTVFDRLTAVVRERGAAFLPLVDPEKITAERAGVFGAACAAAGADGILVGGSTLRKDTLDSIVAALKESTGIPVVLFPGNAAQLTSHADAVLFMSLLSGRNPEFLIGQQVKGAPVIKEYGLEPIATAYLLVSSGTVTAVQYVSETRPIPRNNVETAKAHALCAAYFGMKLVYLEAGSGADEPVPDRMITEVAAYAGLPVMVGGGINTPEQAAAKVKAGATFIVIGTATEEDGSPERLAAFAQAVHGG